MKILVVTPHYYPEHFSITSICESFVKKSHEVLVVTNRPNYGFDGILQGYEKVSEEEINGVRVHRCPIVPRRASRLSIIRNYLSFHRNSRRYIKKLSEEFDVVYSMTLSPVIAASAANLYAKKHHVRHVLHCLDLWPESSVVTGGIRRHSLSYWLLHRWSRKIYEGPDEILLSSPSFEDYLHKEFGLEDKPLLYVPQPVLSCQEKLPAVSYSSKNEFLYVGNIGKLQLVEELVEAFGLVHGDSFHLTLIGMGSRSKAINALIQEKHLEDKVAYLGPMNQIKASAYYEKADFVVVALKNAGMVGKTVPNKLLSAMAFGKPVLGILQGDGRAILEETKGAVFGGEGKEEIAKAIEEAISLPAEKRKEKGEANRAYFQEHFQLDKIVDSILNELKK